MNKFCLSVIIGFLIINPFSMFAHQQESPQDSLILLRVENHINNAQYYSARSYILKILKDPKKDSTFHQTLELDLMSKYIEASIYIKKFDFDSIFTIPVIIKETTAKFSYVNLLAFHSLIPLLKGDISAYNRRNESFILKWVEFDNWTRKNNYKNGIAQYQSALENIIGILGDNNYMNEEEIVLKQFTEVVGRVIDKDNWAYAFNLMGLATYLNNIGLVKQAISLNSEALQYSLQPKILSIDSGIPYTSYNNLTANYMALNKYNDAAHYADSALKCIMRGGNYTEYIRLLLKHINIYNTLGDYEKVKWAKHFSDSVIVIFKVIIDNYENREYANMVIKGLPYIMARSDFNYADYLFNINNLDSAKYYYQKALNVFHGDKSFDMVKREKDTYLRLAWLNYTKGDTAKADNYFNLALEDDKDLLKNVFSVLSDYQKEMYFALLHTDYDQYNYSLVSNIKKNDSTIINLINTRLATKGILMTSANEIKHSSNNNINDSNYSSVKQSLISINDELSMAYIQSLRKKKDSQQYIDSLETLSLEKEKLLTILNNKNITSKLTFGGNWESIKHTLKPNQAAIEIIKIPRFGFYPNIYNPKVNDFYANDSGYYCAVIIKSNSVRPEYVVYNNSRLIEEIYDTYYQKAIYITRQDIIEKDIQQIVKESKNNLKKAYQQLWKKIDNKLNGINKIYISNDGIYDKINPNILIDENGNYILDKYEIEVVTSLNRILTPTRNEVPSQHTASLFGNPDFDNVGSEIVYDNNSIENLSVITLRGNNQLDKKWNNLKQTSKEIEEISSIIAKSNCKVEKFTKEQASEKNVKNLKSPTILHIATHGYFLENSKSSESKKAIGYLNSNPMMNSGLILAGANIDNESNSIIQDGILTASEASRLDLDNTELVVLSACETGLGLVKNGEGVYGLQRAFLLAGANNLMMSLWKVDDLATKELMVQFYKNYLKNSNATLSLRKAQQTLRRNIKFQHPMFWGGFIVVK